MSRSAEPLDRLVERSKENPGGVLFRDFSMRVEARSPDDLPTDGADEIDIAISSEEPVLRYDWWKDQVYYEVLDHGAKSVDLSYVRDGIPFCLDHYLTKQVGIGASPRVDDDKMLRTRVRRGNHPDAAWVFADMRDGVRPKVSVGYDPGDEYVETKGKGDEYPTRRYTKWMPYEVSSVTVPADYGVGVGRSAPGAHPATVAARAAHLSEERTMSVEDNASGAGVAAPVAPPAGPSREAALSALAQQHKREADLPQWILSGQTVQQVKDQLLDEMTARQNARPAVAQAAPVVEVGRNREEDKPWKDDDGVEFMQAVVRAGRGGALDVRLAASRAQNTQVGEDGGFVVPVSVANTLLEASITGGELLSRVTERPVTVGNTYTETVVMEESRVNGSRNGGVRGYWVGEEQEITESQAKTRQHEDKLVKVAALAKLTEEQIEDGPAMLSFLQEQVPEELRFMQEAGIWEGSGAGQPLGAIASGALITVAIEGSQDISNTAGNLWVNAAKMYSRMPTRMLAGAAYFINPALYAKILTATAGTTGGSHPMFTAPGQLAQFPNGAIYGKPIVPIEYASAEGTVGDFVFANFSDYLVIRKGGLRLASSMHVDFVRERQALRFSLRMNGKPRTRTPMTPYKGSSTVSPYIALAARS